MIPAEAVVVAISRTDPAVRSMAPMTLRTLSHDDRLRKDTATLANRARMAAR